MADAAVRDSFGDPHVLEIPVHFAALIVSLVRAGPRWVDALEDLWEWGEQHLAIDRDELEEELGIDA